MNCKISLSHEFEKNLKKLAKRYKSMKDDYAGLVRSLKQDPFQGTDLGKGLRKIRFAITSKGKGKRGGVRVITLTAFISIENAEVILVTIYDKSDKETLSDKEIKDILTRNGLL